MKHAPGPYYVAKTGNYQRLIIDENTGENIAVVYDAKNADVLAAAPDLLEAAEAMVDWFESTDPNFPLKEIDRRNEALKKAIKKAKGETT